jgi:hypothetical protein
MAFMGFLRQSTAVDVLIGPFLDDADGDTPDTDATLDVELSKLGQALANKSDATTPTHDAAGDVDGYYNCELDATDTNTVGILTLVVHHADDLAVRFDFQVVEEAVYDIWFASGATGKVPLQADAISAAEIADDAIAAEHIATGAIVAASFAANAITSTVLADSAITAAKIAADAITSAKIADNAIANEHVADGFITAAKIAADAITEAKIADDAIAAEHIAAAAIVAATFGAGAIDASAIAANAITSSELADGAITAAKLAGDCITADKIADDAIAAEHVAAGALVAASFAANAIDASALATDAVTEILAQAGAGSGIATLLMIDRIYMRLFHEVNITDATGAVAIRDSGDTSDIGTSTITDDDTTTSQAKFGWT